MKRKSNQFDVSAVLNTYSYTMYKKRLLNIALSCFTWRNLPLTVNERYMELKLICQSKVTFFKDEVIGYLCLPYSMGGFLDVYGEPTERTAIGDNGYNKRLTSKDSVLIYDNELHSSMVSELDYYALQLYDIDRAIMVNANAQKTPVLIQCSENERLTMENLYQQYSGNTPFIFGTKNLNPAGLTVLSTGAPYVADKLFQLKSEVWNEAMGFLGIANISVQKRERLLSDEVSRAMGGTLAMRNSRLKARQLAVEQINEMFKLNISVEYNEALDDYMKNSENQQSAPNFPDFSIVKGGENIV